MWTDLKISDEAEAEYVTKIIRRVSLGFLYSTIVGDEKLIHMEVTTVRQAGLDCHTHTHHLISTVVSGFLSFTKKLDLLKEATNVLSDAVCYILTSLYNPPAPLSVI